uniref:Uncharacterized protein n=1 Tax=Rhizophora mucronata TaxID=61149 RepID=A0A2P2N4I4_RHIMU
MNLFSSFCLLDAAINKRIVGQDYSIENIRKKTEHGINLHSKH